MEERGAEREENKRMTVFFRQVTNIFIIESKYLNIFKHLISEFKDIQTNFFLFKQEYFSNLKWSLNLKIRYILKLKEREEEIGPLNSKT